jgi:hypothetical protein
LRTVIVASWGIAAPRNIGFDLTRSSNSNSIGTGQKPDTKGHQAAKLARARPRHSACAFASLFGHRAACDGSGMPQCAFGGCGWPWRPSGGRPLRPAVGCRPDARLQYPRRRNSGAVRPDRGFRPRRRRRGLVRPRYCSSDTLRRHGNDRTTLPGLCWRAAGVGTLATTHECRRDLGTRA